jgi:Na+/H+ antiporter NhaD/arsenite permease-like protein
MLPVNPKLAVAAIFVIAYVLLILFYRRRMIIVWAGVAALLALRYLSPLQAWKAIEWNVVLLYFGMLLVSEAFLYSRMPDFLATLLAGRAGWVSLALLALCLFAGFLSTALENVAVVLLVAPVGLAIARKCEVSPVPLLIGLAVASNLEGAATLIGDPPSMLLAEFAGLSFNDFFILEGRPYIFFATQVGMVAGVAVLFLFFRRFRQKMPAIEKEGYLSLGPTLLVTLLVAALVAGSSLKHGFGYVTGLTCVFFGLASFVWYLVYNRGRELKTFLSRLDWQTGVFLIGIFILVESLSEAGLMEDLAGLIVSLSGDRPFTVYVLVVWFSMLLSAFIDNVPFLLAMLPVSRLVAGEVGMNPHLLYLGLLLGASLGGNVTPIGASANIVAMGILRKQGYTVRFGEFVRIGLPFTLAAVAAGTLFGWLVFSGSGR